MKAPTFDFRSVIEHPAPLPRTFPDPMTGGKRRCSSCYSVAVPQPDRDNETPGDVVHRHSDTCTWRAAYEAWKAAGDEWYKKARHSLPEVRL